jgi:hypothetical protein
MMLVSLPSAPQAATFLDSVLDFLGISASPSTMKGDGDEIAAGEIWVTNLEQGTRDRLVSGATYRWPVFEPGGKAVLALTDNRLVRIPLTRETKAEVMHSLPDVVKLVGFDRKNPDRLLVIRDQPKTPLAVLSVKNGKLADLPYNDDDKDQRRMLAHMRGDERIYPGARVYVITESSKGIEGAREWTDVYMQRGSAKEQNVSRCDGKDCNQPSLSPDGKTVVYIQSQRQP